MQLNVSPRLTRLWVLWTRYSAANLSLFHFAILSAILRKCKVSIQHAMGEMLHFIYHHLVSMIAPLCNFSNELMLI